MSNFSGSNGKGEKAGKRVVYTLLFLSPLFIFALLNLLVLWRTGEGLPCTFYLFTGKYYQANVAGNNELTDNFLVINKLTLTF